MKTGGHQPQPDHAASTTVCSRCGYDLRSQSLGDLCPECGLSVLVATYGDQLRYASPAWLRSLARGTVLIGAGHGLVGLDWAVRKLIPATTWPAPHGRFGVIAALAGWFIVLLGTLEATIRQPDREPEIGRRARLWTRRTSVLVITVSLFPSLVLLMMSMAQTPGHPGRSNMGGLIMLSAAATFLGSWFWLPCLLAMRIHFAGLLKRANQHSMARVLNWTLWVWFLCVLALSVGPFVFLPMGGEEAYYYIFHLFLPRLYPGSPFQEAMYLAINCAGLVYAAVMLWSGHTYSQLTREVRQHDSTPQT